MHIFPQRMCVISLTKLNSWQERYPGSQSSILFITRIFVRVLLFFKKSAYRMWMILKWFSRWRLILYTGKKRENTSIKPFTKEKVLWCCDYMQVTQWIKWNEWMYWCEKRWKKRPNGWKNRRRTFNIALHLCGTFRLFPCFEFPGQFNCGCNSISVFKSHSEKQKH